MRRRDYVRLWLGRHLIHAGLRVLPQGRVRAELWGVLANWSAHVRRELEKARSRH